MSSSPAAPACPKCGFIVFNRRFPKCESCGEPLPPSLVLSTEERDLLLEEEERKAEAAQQEAAKQQRHSRSIDVGVLGPLGDGGSGGGDGGGSDGGCDGGGS